MRYDAEPAGRRIRPVSGYFSQRAGGARVGARAARERRSAALLAGEPIEAFGDHQQVGAVFRGHGTGCDSTQLVRGFAVVTGAQLCEQTLGHLGCLRRQPYRYLNRVADARFHNGCEWVCQKTDCGTALEPAAQSAASLVSSRTLIRAASLSNSRAIPSSCPRVSENRNCSATLRS